MIIIMKAFNVRLNVFNLARTLQANYTIVVYTYLTRTIYKRKVFTNKTTGNILLSLPML